MHDVLRFWLRPRRRRLPDRRRLQASPRTRCCGDDEPGRRARRGLADRSTSACAGIRARARRVRRRPHGGRRGLPADQADVVALRQLGRRAAPGPQLPLPRSCRGTPRRFRAVDRRVRGAGRAGAWPAWCLDNHDHPRVATPLRPRRPRRRARAAVLLLLTLRGTPFLYQGEELGLPRRRDPARARSSTSTAATPSARRSRGSRRRAPARARVHDRASRGCRSPPTPSASTSPPRRATRARRSSLYRALLALRRRASPPAGRASSASLDAATPTCSPTARARRAPARRAELHLRRRRRVGAGRRTRPRRALAPTAPGRARRRARRRRGRDRSRSTRSAARWPVAAHAQPAVAVAAEREAQRPVGRAAAVARRRAGRRPRRTAPSVSAARASASPRPRPEVVHGDDRAALPVAAVGDRLGGAAVDQLSRAPAELRASRAAADQPLTKFSSESGSRRWAATLTASGPNGAVGQRAHELAGRRGREAAVGAGRPLHRRADGEAVGHGEVLAHADLVAVEEHRRAGQA